MKKIVSYVLVTAFTFMTFILTASEPADQKALASTQKKLVEMKTQLNLSSDQETKVQAVLYDAFSNVNSIQKQEGLTKEEKIVRYNKNSENFQGELKKILTKEQYDQYLSSGRGQ
ncbi:MAG: hypothetical protein IH598_10320 [Bacteroidales bacterium]|nr:hypothetical protein [Bacteroidales bacterium]